MGAQPSFATTAASSSLLLQRATLIPRLQSSIVTKAAKTAIGHARSRAARACHCPQSGDAGSLLTRMSQQPPPLSGCNLCTLLTAEAARLRGLQALPPLALAALEARTSTHNKRGSLLPESCTSRQLCQLA